MDTTTTLHTERIRYDAETLLRLGDADRRINPPPPPPCKIPRPLARISSAKIVMSLLNKVTPDNFERIVPKLRDCVAGSSDDPSRVDDLATSLRAKSVSEPTFAETYAKIADALEIDLQFPWPPTCASECGFAAHVFLTHRMQFDDMARYLRALARGGGGGDEGIFVEGLCTFLGIAGRHLEKYAGLLDEIFAAVRASMPSQPAIRKFALMDLVDLRARRWVPRIRAEVPRPIVTTTSTSTHQSHQSSQRHEWRR